MTDEAVETKRRSTRWVELRALSSGFLASAGSGLLVVLGAIAEAQEGRSVSGTVVDESGGAIARARVTIANSDGRAAGATDTDSLRTIPLRRSGIPRRNGAFYNGVAHSDGDLPIQSRLRRGVE